MNATARVPYVKRVPKQGGARRLFEVLFRATKKDAIGVWGGVGSGVG